MRRAPLTLALLMSFAAPASLRAQGTCEFIGVRTCIIPGSAASSVTVVVSRSVLLSQSTVGIALDPPTPQAFDLGFGETVGPTLTVRANTGWALTARVTQLTWMASGPSARADKPGSDLQWGLVAGGVFTDLTTTDGTVQIGAATAGTDIPLFLRVKYAWLLDTPGTYSIPVQLTITAP